MLIAVTGAKGSGKDTLAKVFKNRNFHVIKFADTLKDMLRTLYRSAGVDSETIERKVEGDLKETPCEILNGATPRWAMQSLGTEWAKMVDPTHTIWSNIFRNKVSGLLKEGIPIICTDLRFQHEAEVVRDLAGHVVRVDRPGHEVDDDHPSEKEMNKIQVDVTVGNETSIRMLQEKARKLLNDLTR